MYRNLFAILLTANLLTCPFYCGAKSFASEREFAVSHSCCCKNCMHDAAEKVPGEQPREDDCVMCQCICAGALVDDGHVLVGNPEWNCWQSIAALEVDALNVNAAALLSSFIEALPHDAMNPGRAMRYWFMSLTC
jgi:hypothetical protein